MDKKSTSSRVNQKKPQIDRFRQMARELGADDENEEAFKAKLRVIARQKPKDEPESGAKERQTNTKGDT